MRIFRYVLGIPQLNGSISRVPIHVGVLDERKEPADVLPDILIFDDFTLLRQPDVLPFAKGLVPEGSLYLWDDEIKAYVNSSDTYECDDLDTIEDDINKQLV